MPPPRGTSATRHNCIVSQSEAPVNTLFAEAAAFFARLSPPRHAPNAAGRAAAAHPPRIVGRIPQRPRGIRREKPCRMLFFPPRFPKSCAVQGGCRRTENRPKEAGINFKIAFSHTGDPRLGCSRAQSAEAIRPAALPHSPKRPPTRIAKLAASALIRRTDTRYSARQPER